MKKKRLSHKASGANTLHCLSLCLLVFTASATYTLMKQCLPLLQQTFWRALQSITQMLDQIR